MYLPSRNNVKISTRNPKKTFLLFHYNISFKLLSSLSVSMAKLPTLLPIFFVLLSAFVALWQKIQFFFVIINLWLALLASFLPNQLPFYCQFLPQWLEIASFYPKKLHVVQKLLHVIRLLVKVAHF